MGLFDFLSDAMSLPLRIAQIPANVLERIAGRVDPNDDAGIRSAAEELSNAYKLPFDVCEKAIRDSFED